MSSTTSPGPLSSPGPSNGQLVRSDPNYAAFNPREYFLDALPLRVAGKTSRSAGEGDEVAAERRKGPLELRCERIRDEAVEWFNSLNHNGIQRDRAYSLVKEPLPSATGGNILDAVRLRQALYAISVQYINALNAPPPPPLPDGKKYPRRLNNAPLVLRHPDAPVAKRAHFEEYPAAQNNLFTVLESFLEGCLTMGDSAFLKSPRGLSSAAEAAAHVSDALCKAAGKMLGLNNVLMVAALLGTDLTYDRQGSPVVPEFMKNRHWGRNIAPSRTDIFRAIILCACYSPISLLVDRPLQWEPLPLHPLVDTFATHGRKIPFDWDDEEAAGCEALHNFFYKHVIGGLIDMVHTERTSTFTPTKIKGWAAPILKALREELSPLFLGPDDPAVPKSQIEPVDWPDREVKEEARLIEEAQKRGLKRKAIDTATSGDEGRPTKRPTIEPVISEPRTPESTTSALTSLDLGPVVHMLPTPTRPTPDTQNGGNEDQHNPPGPDESEQLPGNKPSGERTEDESEDHTDAELEENNGMGGDDQGPAEKKAGEEEETADEEQQTADEEEQAAEEKRKAAEKKKAEKEKKAEEARRKAQRAKERRELKKKEKEQLEQMLAAAKGMDIGEYRKKRSADRRAALLKAKEEREQMNELEEEEDGEDEDTPTDFPVTEVLKPQNGSLPDAQAASEILDLLRAEKASSNDLIEAFTTPPLYKTILPKVDIYGAGPLDIEDLIEEYVASQKLADGSWDRLSAGEGTTVFNKDSTQPNHVITHPIRAGVSNATVSDHLKAFTRDSIVITAPSDLSKPKIVPVGTIRALWVSGEWMREAKEGQILNYFSTYNIIIVKGAIPEKACLALDEDGIRQDPKRDVTVVRRAQLQCDLTPSFEAFINVIGGHEYIDLSLSDLVQLRLGTEPYPPVISLLSYPRGQVLHHIINDTDLDAPEIEEWIPNLSTFAHCIEAWDALGHIPNITTDIDPPTAISAWEMYQLKGSYSPPHMDFGGTCTSVLMLAGKKVWFHFDSDAAIAQLHPKMSATAPFPDTEGLGVVLEAGDAMFMAPHFHAVVSTEHCIVKGSNFYCMVQMEATLRARIIQHHLGPKVTNVNQPRAYMKLFALMIRLARCLKAREEMRDRKWHGWAKRPTEFMTGPLSSIWGTLEDVFSLVYMILYQHKLWYGPESKEDVASREDQTHSDAFGQLYRAAFGAAEDVLAWLWRDTDGFLRWGVKKLSDVLEIPSRIAKTAEDHNNGAESGDEDDSGDDSEGDADGDAWPLLAFTKVEPAEISL
ncbi:hypothetical protein CALCODRAFT_519383 [Calocera cornea HHB12733]|uniref:JmjC domain-containing protein n=1 Tax=Calocera cornea HHB12733 TaxID=1353952 RepID=A0A165EBF6_9BASI|nr:hypothetical protein CALCODRAFT_519383 [Calocera cornea HHB12733]